MGEERGASIPSFVLEQISRQWSVRAPILGRTSVPLSFMTSYLHQDVSCRGCLHVEHGGVVVVSARGAPARYVPLQHGAEY